MPSNPALILFIKNPIPGKTKTRLAATVGDEMALKMYNILTEWTREQAEGLGEDVTRYLYYSNEITEGDSWPSDKFIKRVQVGPGLGERMNNAFQDVFAEGHEKAILIGSDCPGITSKYLDNAFQQLDLSDVVIGPALDGGYTLLGSRRSIPELFLDMEWSTDRVLRETLLRADQVNCTVEQLNPLSDVDYIEDWHSYGWPLPT